MFRQLTRFPSIARYRSLRYINALRSLNILTRSLEYVKKVDAEQYKLVHDSSVLNKISELLERISNNKETLYLLALFHDECKKVGITHSTEGREKSLKFFLSYYFRLKPIHNSFWETCQLLGISNHNHKIQCNPMDLGLIDPKNFDAEFLDELKLGVYKGLDFRDVQTFSYVKPDFKAGKDDE